MDVFMQNHHNKLLRNFIFFISKFASKTLLTCLSLWDEMSVNTKYPGKQKKLKP